MEIKANPGDYVKIQLTKKELEGVFIESHDKTIVLLKLNSGYNIGINKENILGLKVIKKYKEEKTQEVKLTHSKNKKTIGLIVTGGTIASKLDVKTGGVKALSSVDEFIRFYPKLFEKYNVEISIPFMKDSSAMNSDDWKTIADSVHKMLNHSDIEGVIITHGTDTLHYTSAALSFFLRNLNKPVVLTYSQRSIDRASSDAELNLLCAAEFAVSDCAEVAIVGHAGMDDDYCYAIRGTKARKMHSSRRDAFKPINSRPIAKIFTDRVEFLEQRRPRNSQKAELDAVFNDKIALIKFYPGQEPDLLDFYKDYKGIILETFGMGQIGGSEAKKSWNIKLKKLIKSGVIVCATSQTIYGRVNSKVYSAGRELEETGVIFLEDMLSETAFVKLGWVLGHRSWKAEKMLEDFAGEVGKLLSE